MDTKKHLPALDRMVGRCYYKQLYQCRQNAETSPLQGSFRMISSDDCKYCTMLRAKNQEEIIKKFTAFAGAALTNSTEDSGSIRNRILIRGECSYDP